MTTTTVTTGSIAPTAQVIQISLRQWYYNSDRPLYVQSLAGRISEQEYKNILDTLRPIMKLHYDAMKKYFYMSIAGGIMFGLGLALLILFGLFFIVLLVPGVIFIIIAASRRTFLSRMMETDLLRVITNLNNEWQPKGVSFALIVPSRRAIGNFFVSITVAPATTIITTTTTALPTTSLLVGQPYGQPPAQYYYPPAQPYPQGQPPYQAQPYQGQPYPQQPYQGQPYPQQPYQGEPYQGQPPQPYAQAPSYVPPQNGEPQQQPPTYIPPQ